MGNPIVETRYGKVQGYEQGAISVWKGIPFAKPPTAQLRFRAAAARALDGRARDARV